MGSPVRVDTVPVGLVPAGRARSRPEAGNPAEAGSRAVVGVVREASRWALETWWLALACPRRELERAEGAKARCSRQGPEPARLGREPLLRLGGLGLR